MAFTGNKPVLLKFMITHRIIEEVYNFQDLGYNTTYDNGIDSNNKNIKFNLI